MKIKTLIELLRPINCTIAAVAAFIGYSLSINSFSFNQNILLVLVSVFLICGAGQTINDYFDRNIDAKIKKTRPIPAKKIKARTVLNYSILLFLIGIILSALVNIITLLIAIIFSALLIIYSWKMKKLKFIGNYLVALATAFTFIYGASINTNFFPALFPATLAFLVNSSREITKDLEDFKKGETQKTILVNIIKEKNTKIIITIFLVLAIIISFIPWIILLFNWKYMIIQAIADSIIIKSIIKLLKEDYKESQKNHKIAMIISLIAFITTLL